MATTLICPMCNLETTTEAKIDGAVEVQCTECAFRWRPRPEQDTATPTTDSQADWT